MNDIPHAPATPPGTGPDRETLARAVLTHLIDHAEPIMHATLTGAGDAVGTLRLIIESAPGRSGRRPGGADIDHAFATGLARWGRKVTPERMRAFHTALAGWHARLATLPSPDWWSLGGWFTRDGRQWLIAPHSPYWPHQLQDLSTRKDWAAPLCLWGVGDMRALTSCPKPIAVVGSRGATDYGRTVAREVATRAARDGHLVISGGAMGTDAAAHWGALAAIDEERWRDGGIDAATGRTVAVFAGGLDHIGPSANLRLFERIVGHGGALISELCPGTIPEARRFLLRNRIIAALASTVVVAQARMRSGALNTANWAYELNRELIAVPGEITTPYNAGCNRIISQHQAMLLASPDEIAELLHAPHRAVTGPEPPPASTPSPSGPDGDADVLLSEGQRVTLAAIRSCRRRHDAVTVDALLARLGGADGPWPVGRLLANLGELELLGLVRHDDGGIRISGPAQKHTSGAVRPTQEEEGGTGRSATSA